MSQEEKLPKILIVEDDERLARLTQEYLIRNGLEVGVETDGNRAIRRIISEQPDMVVLDVMLPGADGLTVCREVRPHYHQPILMLTARTEDMDQVLGLEMGADEYTLVDGSVKPNVVYDALKYNKDFTAKTIDANDIVTYKLNNEFEVSVTMGESLTADWDTDPNTVDTTQVIDQNNLTRALVFKINSDANMKESIVAYNGDYTIDANGNKITNNNQDNFLRVESILQVHQINLMQE